MSAGSAEGARRSQHDRGLQAVRRVRAARERDSRLGLRRAIEEHRALAARAEQLSRGLAEASRSVSTVGTASAYAVDRAHLVALGERLSATRAAVESARRVVETSRDHWISDHRGLESVDGLLARRRESREAEAALKRARDDDETAARIWLRASAEREAATPSKTGAVR